MKGYNNNSNEENKAIFGNDLRSLLKTVRKAALKEAIEIVYDYMGEIEHTKVKFNEKRLKCGICKIGDDIIERLEKEAKR